MSLKNTKNKFTLFKSSDPNVGSLYNTVKRILSKEFNKNIEKYYDDRAKNFYFPIYKSEIYLAGERKPENGDIPSRFNYTHDKIIYASAHSLEQMYSDRKTSAMTEHYIFDELFDYIQQDILEALVKGMKQKIKVNITYLFYSQKYHQGFVSWYGDDPRGITTKTNFYMYTVLPINATFVKNEYEEDGTPIVTLFRGIPEEPTIPLNIYPTPDFIPEKDSTIIESALKNDTPLYSSSFIEFINSYISTSKILKENETYLFSYITTEDFTIVLREGKFFGLQDIEIIEI